MPPFADMIHLIDLGIPILAALISAALVLRWGIWGFFAGVGVVWVFLVGRVELLGGMDSDYEKGFPGMLAFAMGIPLGTVWCLPFLIGRTIYRNRRKFRRG